MTSRNEWQDIAEKASNEFDADKLRELVEELNCMLAEEVIGKRAEIMTYGDLSNPKNLIHRKAA
jgi:hypothetical protein